MEKIRTEKKSDFIRCLKLREIYKKGFIIDPEKICETCQIFCWTKSLNSFLSSRMF